MHRKPTLKESLERWWTKKYNEPSNSDLFTTRTWFDLLTEFHLDRFDAKPLEVYRQADGEIQFKDTGDELLDKWENQLANGDDVDLEEAFNEESFNKLQKMLVKAKEHTITQAYAEHLRAKHGDPRNR